MISTNLRQFVSFSFADTVPVCTQLERVKIFEDECQRMGLHNQTEQARFAAYAKLLCDDRHRLLYLGFLKAGSSTWLKMLMDASGKPARGVLHYQRQPQTYGLKRLSLDFFTKEEILYRIQNYFAFVVVRNPFDHLVSVWRNKFVDPTGVHYQLSRKVAKMYPRAKYYNATGRYTGLPDKSGDFPPVCHGSQS